MKKKLSYRQERILGFISSFLRDHPFPPTVRDIQSGCDISSTSVVDYNLQILQREGYLHREAEVSRGIELLGEGSGNLRGEIVSIPVLGYVAAGEPLHIPSQDSWHTDAIDNVELPASLVPNSSEVFGLRVKGESMIDALVADGDLVLLEQADIPRDGDMVAAEVFDRGITLKHFHMANGLVTLQPANSAMDPIIAPADQVTVRGKVVGVVRTM